MVLGLTGGYCAGKSTAAAILARRGWTIVDVDRAGHAALEASREAVAARFGHAVLGADGSIDRKALGRLLFSDPEALAAHEAIVHPAMNAAVDRALDAALEEAARAGREALVCVDAALLYRLPVLGRCEAVLETRASLPVRLLRAKRRDGLAAPAALARIGRQRGLWKLRSRAGRPVLRLGNDGTTGELEAALDRALARVAALPSRRMA